MNLIYQYYDGPTLPGTEASIKVMKEYAERIGAEHLFESNPQWIKSQGRDLGRYTPHYGQFKIVYDEYFEKYDNVLFLDTDIFPVEGLEENIFDLDVGDLGICTEDFQPKARLKGKGQATTKKDEKWASLMKQAYGVDMPRQEDNLLKVYNSGVVLYTKKGREKCRKNFVKFERYCNFVNRYGGGLPAFYTSDQYYIHAMLEAAKLDYTDMPSGWNSFVHFIGDRNLNPRPVNDMRTKDTKFVHIQLSAADHFDADKLYRITNLPQSEWQLEK